jgi:hypothetical protein
MAGLVIVKRTQRRMTERMSADPHELMGSSSDAIPTRDNAAENHVSARPLHQRAITASRRSTIDDRAAPIASTPLLALEPAEDESRALNPRADGVETGNRFFQYQPQISAVPSINPVVT